jgi:hypothetical protein
MADSKPVSTPMVPGVILLKLKSTPEAAHSLPYQSAVGILLYIVLASRPDIAFSVGVLSCHVAVYNKTHWMAVKHLLCYLQGTQGLSIIYECMHNSSTSENSLVPTRYCNTDWGGNINTCKSVSSFVFTLAGGPVMWSSKLQTTVALSSTKAELNTLTEAAKQAMYMHKFFSPLKINNTSILAVYNDNQSALHLATQPKYTFHAHMKHFDIKLHFLHDMIANGHIGLHYCPTETMPVDMLTKALPRARLSELLLILGLHN